MSTFAEILERKLGRKISKDKTVTADVLAGIEAKGLALKGTFEVKGRLNEEIDLSGFISDAEGAAAARVDLLLDGMLTQDLWDPDRRTKYRVSSSIQVPDKVSGLRDSKGRFISGLQLSRVLNLVLHDEVERLMGTGNRLEYKTGRLANSAQVTKIGYDSASGDQRKSRVSIFFQYMLAPYEVFEQGHAMHKQGRSPTILIKTAIMNALKKALSPSSFKKAIFNIGGTR